MKYFTILLAFVSTSLATSQASVEPALVKDGTNKTKATLTDDCFHYEHNFSSKDGHEQSYHSVTVKSSDKQYVEKAANDFLGPDKFKKLQEQHSLLIEGAEDKSS